MRQVVEDDEEEEVEKDELEQKKNYLASFVDHLQMQM